MKFNVTYVLQGVGGTQVSVPNKINPVLAKNVKELLLAIAANIQCGADMELPIAGIHISSAENE